MRRGGFRAVSRLEKPLGDGKLIYTRRIQAAPNRDIKKVYVCVEKTEKKTRQTPRGGRSPSPFQGRKKGGDVRV